MGPIRISDAELEIMQALWASDTPLSAAQIRQALDNGWERTTVATLLARLLEKGVISAAQQGRGRVYAPLLTREDYSAHQGRRLLSSLYGGSAASFVAAMYNGGALSDEDLSALRALIDGWEEARHD